MKEIKNTRKGFKRECELKIFHAMIPILMEYRNRASKDEFWGFINSTFLDLVKVVEDNKPPKHPYDDATEKQLKEIEQAIKTPRDPDEPYREW